MPKKVVHHEEVGALAAQEGLLQTENLGAVAGGCGPGNLPGGDVSPAGKAG